MATKKTINKLDEVKVTAKKIGKDIAKKVTEKGEELSKIDKKALVKKVADKGAKLSNIAKLNLDIAKYTVKTKETMYKLGKLVYEKKLNIEDETAKKLVKDLNSFASNIKKAKAEIKAIK